MDDHRLLARKNARNLESVADVQDAVVVDTLGSGALLDQIAPIFQMLKRHTFALPACILRRMMGGRAQWLPGSPKGIDRNLVNGSTVAHTMIRYGRAAAGHIAKFAHGSAGAHCREHAEHRALSLSFLHLFLDLLLAEPKQSSAPCCNGCDRRRSRNP